MNKATIAKVGWRVLHTRDSLWARVLRSKYRVGEVDWLAKKGRWSAVWRSVVTGLREVVIPGLAWVIGDGASIKFWKDQWLGEDTLESLAIQDIPVELAHLRARDLWINGVGWDLSRVEQFLPRFTVLRLLSVMVDSVTGIRDRLAWGPSVDGRFSVKSAYQFLSRRTVPMASMNALYDRVWKAAIPERTRVFFWLVVNQVIMTNSERFRRHLCDSSLCSICKSGEETIIHVLRDCPAMHGIWCRIVPQNKRSEFFQQSLMGWIFQNLGCNHSCEGIPWSTLFAMAAWWGWKWRCGNIFTTTGLCRDRVRFVKDRAKQVHQANSVVHGGAVPRVYELRQISWKPPPDGWVRLNSDGAARGNPGLATAGGVLRDADGNWIRGFALNIGVCSATIAELWGVYYGLCLAWDCNTRQLELQIDSALVVSFLTTGIGDTHPMSFLVRMCYGFLSKNWTVRISHTYREGNRLADGLADYAFSQPLGVYLFDSCPLFVAAILEEDSRGLAHGRNILL